MFCPTFIKEGRLSFKEETANRTCWTCSSVGRRSAQLTRSPQCDPQHHLSGAVVATRRTVITDPDGGSWDGQNLRLTLGIDNSRPIWGSFTPGQTLTGLQISFYTFKQWLLDMLLSQGPTHCFLCLEFSSSRYPQGSWTHSFRPRLAGHLLGELFPDYPTLKSLAATPRVHMAFLSFTLLSFLIRIICCFCLGSHNSISSYPAVCLAQLSFVFCRTYFMETEAAHAASSVPRAAPGCSRQIPDELVKMSLPALAQGEAGRWMAPNPYFMDFSSGQKANTTVCGWCSSAEDLTKYYTFKEQRRKG